MEPRRFEAWSLPDDPEGFRSLLELPFLAGSSWQDPNDTPGKGSVVLPSDYEDLDTVLFADPTAVANSRSCLICAFRESSEIPDFEFFADQRIDPIGDGSTSIIGPDIRSGLNDGKIFPRAPDDPIWLWGQKTLTKNSDLTEGTVADEEFEIWIIGAGGTWRIDLGGGFSGTIDDDATNSDVKDAIEAGPSTVVECNVTGQGTSADPWRIHIVDPSQTDYTVVVDDASLTGDIYVRLLTDGGDIRPTYYTPAQTIGGVLFGVMGEFQVVDDPFGGPGKALFVTGNSAYIGAQQILQGVQGLHGYADVQFGFVSGPATMFRLGIRNLDEDWLYTVEQSITAGSWQTVTIPSFALTLNEVILRAAVIEDSPVDFYIRLLNIYPGMPGTDWGDIVGQLTAAIQARGVLTWLDLSLVTPGVDSDLVAWDNPSLAFRADPGMDLGTHVMSDGQDAGYEYDVVRLPPPYTVGNPTHQLLIYNRLGRGETPTTDPAVIVGDLDSGQLAKRRIAFTHLLVEYAFPPLFVEVTHVDFAAMPRREGYLRAEQALDEATAIQIGETYLLDQVDDLLATQVRPTSIDPYRDLDVGWQIPYELGSHAGRHIRRIHTISARFEDPDWTGELTASHLFATDQAAMWEAIRRLQEAFDRRNRAREPQPITPSQTGCCPSCMARAFGFVSGTMAPTLTSLGFSISRDPDQILLADDNLDRIYLRKPGFYTFQVDYGMRWNHTAAGWSGWLFEAEILNNDAPPARETKEQSTSAAGIMTIRTNLNGYGHTALADQRFTMEYSQTGQQSAGLVNTSTGVVLSAQLAIVRHSPGCAVIPGSA